MSRARRCLVLVLALLPVFAAARRADGACNATCKRDMERCMATQCEGIAPKACRRRCKPARIRTLAYVLSECRNDAGPLPSLFGRATGFSIGHQALRIRRGDREPITVAEFGPSGPISGPDPLGLCRQYWGEARWGSASVFVFPLQRLGVSPDGSEVVFEVNTEFLTAPIRGGAGFEKRISGFTLSPEQEGMFVVRSDGRGLRRLGPPSHERSFAALAAYPPPISFSPNGSRIAFSDRGPGPDGQEAPQIVVLDLATGKRTQVTHLPSGTPPSYWGGDFFLTCCPVFIDNETVLFQTFVDPDGSNPEHYFAAFTVRIDGSGLKAVPKPVAVPGSQVVPSFGVTGLRKSLIRLTRPDTPFPPFLITDVFELPITEVFVQEGKQLLQLTNFGKPDTFIGFLSPTRTRAFFLASADPLGTNPQQNCQIFSVDTVGGGLRQVTDFNLRGVPPHWQGSPDVRPGCFGPDNPPACSVGEGYYRTVFQDPVTNAVVFASSCDPFGANPRGAQIFALGPDGRGLRQLTDASGITPRRDGLPGVNVEFPGPFAYSAAPH